MSFATLVPALQEIQNAQLTDRCDVTRDGVLVHDNIPCRVHKDRLFSEPPDPQDANMRSMQEWGFTFQSGIIVRIGDTMTIADRDISAIAGEIVAGGTWETAVRVWATEPKISTPFVPIEFWRWSAGLEDFVSVGVLSVQVVYDRNQPEETPLRYAPAAYTQYKGGWVVGGPTLDVRQGDRFTIGGLAAVIDNVLPGQPQRTEARFTMDISGSRGMD